MRDALSKFYGDPAILRAAIAVLLAITAILALSLQRTARERDAAERHVLHMLDGATLTAEDRDHL